MEEEEGEKYRLSKGSPVVCLARVGAEAEMIVRTWHWDSGTRFGDGNSSAAQPDYTWECHFLRERCS